MADLSEASPADVIRADASLPLANARVSDPVLRRGAPLWWWIALGLCGFFTVILIIAATNLFVAGIGLWGVNIPIAWGLALANYVWWIGIASGGTIISALFYLLQTEWRTATNRIAESITMWGAACAGLMPIFHLGRQGLFYWLFPYPNVMTVWPQFRSPLLWDFFALICYIAASILFWYLGAIPDFATLRDRAPTRGKQIFYGIVAMGWLGSARQWKRFRVVYGILAALLAPMVMSVHSVVGLDFAGGLTPGWHSTQFPPYFVFGAVYSGIATTLLLIIPVRRLYKLESVITPYHFNVLGKLMLACGLMLTYAYAFEAFIPFYGHSPFDMHMFDNRLFGIYAGAYWAKIALNCVIPQLLWFPRIRVNRWALFLISFGIVAGMWIERYIIVVTSLYQDFLPSAWYFFDATLWDWGIFFGSIGLFLTGFIVVLRFVPIVSLAETRELIHRHKADA
jgi:molybdopterin-containing oxidoreductase family membrane subunit